MAKQRHAIVEFNEAVGTEGQWIGLRMHDEEEPLGDQGGQYVIVHTGLQSDDGKPIKRTYSIVWSAPLQQRFELAVKPLATGAGASRHVANLRAGDSLVFSGPWGKKVVPDASARPWLLATDTGITTLLGLVRSPAWALHRRRTRIVWFRPPEDGFLKPSWVHGCLAPSGAHLEIKPILEVGSERRVEQACAWLQDMLAEGAPPTGYALLSGDGLVVRGVRTLLEEAGLAPDSVVMETFFNKPPKR